MKAFIPLSKGAPLLDWVDDSLIGVEVSAHITVGHFVVLVVILILHHVVVLGGGGGSDQRQLSLLLASEKHITKQLAQNFNNIDTSSVLAPGKRCIFNALT